jgi:hypothetical protein
MFVPNNSTCAIPGLLSVKCDYCGGFYMGVVFTWGWFLCTFILTLFVMLVVSTAHAFQPLKYIGHIEVYRQKRTFKSLVIHEMLIVIYHIYI